MAWHGPTSSGSFNDEREAARSLKSSSFIHSSSILAIAIAFTTSTRKTLNPIHPELRIPSLRIVPARSNPNSFAHTSHTSSAPSAPGIHDTLRHGLGPSPFDSSFSSSSAAAAAAAAAQPISRHPLEARLKNWEATQESVKMESLRRTFGVAEPVRRAMELKLVRDGEWRPMLLGAAGGLPSVHEDILRGRDDSLQWEDVFTGDEMRPLAGFHDEMEKKLSIR
ncbi:Proteasome maturation factor UMP1 [Escovopsis weberi]|uniref:Proteasome maturation factor UMP1 n=1 Tax=Escovopsis weberi TaxID=150374 RepID=A0A0M8MSU6_ESCWE|nr:Proteasome maturation factor UMP1 [Escovopsis weberi]